MEWKPWAIWLVLLGAGLAALTLGLAFLGWIPWIAVSVVTVACGVGAAIVWSRDRRVLRRLLEQPAADE